MECFPNASLDFEKLFIQVFRHEPRSQFLLNTILKLLEAWYEIVRLKKGIDISWIH